MKKIIILDNSIGDVIITNFDENIYDTEEISSFYDELNAIHDLHLKDSQCSWMLSVDNKLPITIL